MSKQYKPTCYEQIIADLVKNPAQEIFYEDYPEFEQRGHTESEVKTWLDYANLAFFLMNCSGSINQKKAFARAVVSYYRDKTATAMNALLAAAVPLELDLKLDNLPWQLKNIKNNPIINYRLLPDEISTILQAERLGRGFQGNILSYEDQYGKKNVTSVDYRKIVSNLGRRKDIFVVFSGHQQTGPKAAEAIYRYIAINDKLPEGVIFLGLEDNQNLTEFNDSFVIRQQSEYQMYYNELKALGLPGQWLDKLAMIPTDTDTFQNIGLLVNTLKKYRLDHVNLYFISSPAYQLRVASEFAFGLTAREDAPDCHLFIADIAPKKFADKDDAFQALMRGAISMEEYNHLSFDDFRVLSYDKPEMQLLDLTLANCVAHLYREHGKTRFAIPGLTKYPDSFKSLAPLGLGYSYPNVVNELCGTDETIAGILKIMRTLMLDEHDKGISGASQDAQQQWYVNQTGQKLLAQKLTTSNILKNGYHMTVKEFLPEVLLG